MQKNFLIKSYIHSQGEKSKHNFFVHYKFKGLSLFWWGVFIENLRAAHVLNNGTSQALTLRSRPDALISSIQNYDDGLTSEIVQEKEMKY